MTGAKLTTMEYKCFYANVEDGFSTLQNANANSTKVGFDFCGGSQVNDRRAATMSTEFVDKKLKELGLPPCDLPKVRMRIEGYININNRHIEGGVYEAYYSYI